MHATFSDVTEKCVCVWGGGKPYYTPPPTFEDGGSWPPPLPTPLSVIDDITKVHISWKLWALQIGGLFIQFSFVRP